MVGSHVRQSRAFHIHDSFAAGCESANVGTISAYLPGDWRVDTDGVFVYRVNESGLITSLRAFWEVDREVSDGTSAP
jgi:hypothetical protein